MLTYSFFYSNILSMKTLILASNNKGKLEEIRAILKDRFEVLSLSDCKISADIEETGATFEENALIKAKAVYRMTGLPVISDDSGLAVYALDGAPGVYSARFAGDEHDDEKNNEKLLNLMKGKDNRDAAFVCCAVFYDGSRAVSAEGRAEGKILEKKDGDNGFGYDPLFYSYDLNKSFGCASFEEKNSVSHRARAFNALAEKL